MEVKSNYSRKNIVRENDVKAVKFRGLPFYCFCNETFVSHLLYKIHNFPLYV